MRDCERMLFDPTMAERWQGLGLAWLETLPHEVRTDLTTERNVLVMIDSGAVRTEFGYGLRTCAFDLAPGSLGWFSRGTLLRHSHWRWSGARRIALDLESAVLPDAELTEQLRAGSRETEFEFQDEALAAVLRCMAREVASGCPNGPLFAESLSMGVALRLQARSRTRHGRERGRLSPAQLARLEELIRLRLDGEISLAMLAATTGYSAAQFVRLFRNTVGCAPYQYVLKTRLERARDMVVASDLPLSAIAQQTGFASQSHMTSAFVRAFEAPPGELRRRGRSGVGTDAIQAAVSEGR